MNPAPTNNPIQCHRRGDSRIARGNGYEDAAAMPLCRRGGVTPPAVVGVTKMHRLFSSAVITFASPLRGGKGGVFVHTKMHRRCGFHIRRLLHRLRRSPLPEGASYIRSPTDSRDGEGICFCGGSKPPPLRLDGVEKHYRCTFVVFCLRAGKPRPYGLSYPKRL